jgi:hypothetical protein
MTPWRQLDLLKGPRQRGTKPPLALEVATHIAIADLLRAAARPDWWWSHIGHGGKRTVETGALLKRMGLRPGISDFLFYDPDGQERWLELKRGPAPLSDGQLDFIGEMTKRNVTIEVARSYREAEAQLKAWGALRLAP